VQFGWNSWDGGAVACRRCVTRKAQKEAGVEITRGGKALAEIVM